MISSVDSIITHTTNKKNKSKSGSVHEIDKINNEYLDRILHKNNL